jgi:hypothetical protein
MGKQKKLTPKQLKFARLICNGTSHADAYRGAYNTSNMKADSIQKKAWELLQNVHVSGMVQHLKEQLDKKHLITREEMILDYMKMRSVNVMDMIDHIENVDGIDIVRWKDKNLWTEEQIRAVKSIKQTSVGIQLEFHDIVQINEKIAKMLGWDAPTKHEIKNVDEFAELTDEEINKQLELAKMGRN